MKQKLKLPPSGVLRDLEEAELKRDIRFFRRWLSGARGTVLEINAGTGRITLPLIQDGLKVTALDDDAGLLTHLAEKAESLDPAIQKRLTLWHGGLTELTPHTTWSRIILPGNALCHYLQDPELDQALRNIRAMLSPRGRGMLAVMNPDPALLNSLPVWQHRLTAGHGGGEIRCSVRRQYDRWQQILTTETRWQFIMGQETLEKTETRHQRMFFPRELPVILQRAGLKVTGVLGDWDGRAPSPDCANQLLEFSRGRI